MRHLSLIHLWEVTQHCGAQLHVMYHKITSRIQYYSSAFAPLIACRSQITKHWWYGITLVRTGAMLQKAAFWYWVFQACHIAGQYASPTLISSFLWNTNE
jgi:hypothetical protein